MSKWDQLHPTFRPLAERVFRSVEDMAARCGCTPFLVSTYRSGEKQWELYRKGRKLVGVDWVRDPSSGSIVTNAKPHQTPHCAELKDGTPAALAMDIALLENGKWLGDYDVRWSIIPCSVTLVGLSSLTSGAFFRKLRDYPHVEYKDWKKLWPAK